MTAISPDDPALRPLQIRESPLEGKKALVVGIANKDSIAYGCARAFRAFGADLSITYLNEKTKQYTAQLARALDVEEALYLPCDVREPGQLESVFDTIRREWGRLDILLHSIAYAPRDDLHGRVTDCSLAGFRETMDVSVHSLIRMARLAEPLMTGGGAIFTMSYFGGEKVVPHYGIMGPAKAALETAARYMAAELGREGHSRQHHLAGSGADARRVRHRPLRRAAGGDQATRADPHAGNARSSGPGYGGARLRLRRDRHRRDPLHGRRLQHHGRLSGLDV